MQLVNKMYALYAAVVFLSAYLLFQVQPIAGKLLLPFFGGSAAVWTTSLLFFSGMLFVGYVYAYFLSRYTLRRQVTIHLVVLCFGIIADVATYLGESTFRLTLESLAGQANPATGVLFALLVRVGVPYFVIATTGPLLQQWYAIAHKQEPYTLYAISNTGSLVGLAAYPFVIEPFSTLSTQQHLWELLFAVFIALCACICLYYRKSAHAADTNFPEIVVSTLYQKMSWIVFSAVPTFVLVATTIHLTHLVAPIPLLWVLLLAVYLGAFIVVFSGNYIPYISIHTLIASGIVIFFLEPRPRDMLLVIAANCVFLACASLYCNQRLYRARPGLSEPALYYVHIAFGGMVGTLCASTIAPIIFSDYWEYPVGIATVVVVVLWGLLVKIPKISIRTRYLAGACIAVAAVFVVSKHIHDSNAPHLLVQRNFYGTAKIDDTRVLRYLMNGSTLHGLQPKSAQDRYAPLGYYTPESAVGRSFMYERTINQGKPLDVHVIGLGAGMTAAYCVSGDRFTYSDIDPKIIAIAHAYFTYLDHCAGAVVRQGDARTMFKTDTNTYDLIVMDAFSDDAIPSHLLTREAMREYLSHLRGPESIIAVHISNRYFDLLPSLMGLAAAEKLSLLYNETTIVSDDPTITSSYWVLVSPGEKTFSAKIFEGAASPFSAPPMHAWTDDYINIIGALRSLPQWARAFEAFR